MFVRMVVMSMLVICAGRADAQAVVESQGFNSASSAASAGWASLGASQNGNSFGFSASNQTGGASLAGEMGGTIARTLNLAYYGDLTLGGSPTLGYQLHASGELNPLSYSNFNNAIRIGFFNAANMTGFIEFAGFQVAEYTTTPGLFRVIPTIHFLNGSRAESQSSLLLAANSQYTWTSDFDPLLGHMTVEVFNSGGSSLGASMVDLTLAQAGYSAAFNAFGLLTGGLGQDDSSNVATVYVDNLTYSFTPVPEPGSLMLCGLGAAFVFGRRVLRRAPGQNAAALQSGV